MIAQFHRRGTLAARRPPRTLLPVSPDIIPNHAHRNIAQFGVRSTQEKLFLICRLGGVFLKRNKYVVLGGGMVAGYAAKELVNRGLSSGELTIISADDALPYERPPLSKGFLSGKDKEAEILINPPEWYAQQGIDVKLKTVIQEVDLKKRLVRAKSGEAFEFEYLLVATGARARQLDCPRKDLRNVFYLRSLDDSRKIRQTAASVKRATVVGGGFIGMEVASVLAQKNIETTLIIREDRVWSRVFTPAMSEFFERYYASRGVRLLKRETVSRLEGQDSVSTAVLSSGSKVPCEMVVAGVGASPVTELFIGTGLAVDNGIVVNEYLETNQTGVYAAGDVANYFDTVFNKRRRVEHWDNAVSQGRHWASVVRGDRRPFEHVPYFFSDIFDLSYELWGDAEGATQTLTRGDLKTPSFSVWWLNGNRLIAAFTMNRPDEERELAPEWIKTKRDISTERLKDQDRPLREAI
jgi:NADPH-dependent 2,4-dienoyl-CoA reductase/sulfur reductase-like enzyme